MSGHGRSSCSSESREPTETSLEPTAGRCKPARANAVQHTWPSSVATHRSMVLCFDSRPAGSVTIELLIKLSKPLRDFLLADASKRGDCCQVLAARRRFACFPSVDRLPGRTHEPAELFSAQAQALAIFASPDARKRKRVPSSSACDLSTAAASTLRSVRWAFVPFSTSDSRRFKAVTSALDAASCFLSGSTWDLTSLRAMRAISALKTEARFGNSDSFGLVCRR